jgi:hypothetical protein
MFGGKRNCKKCELHELARQQAKRQIDFLEIRVNAWKKLGEERQSVIDMMRGLLADALTDRRQDAEEPNLALRLAAERMAAEAEEAEEASDGEASELNHRISEVHLGEWRPDPEILGDPMTTDIFAERSSESPTEKPEDGDTS